MKEKYEAPEIVILNGNDSDYDLQPRITIVPLLFIVATVLVFAYEIAAVISGVVHASTHTTAINS